MLTLMITMIISVPQDPTRSEEVKVEEVDRSDFMCVMTGNTFPYTHRIQVCGPCMINRGPVNLGFVDF